MRYSLGAILFAGVFDRYPRLNVGSVEHETMWIPHWLQQMDFTYRERPVFTKGWKSRPGYGCGAKATGRALEIRDHRCRYRRRYDEGCLTTITPTSNPVISPGPDQSWRIQVDEP